MNRKQRILFLCTGNSARSQMAEAFLRYYGGDRFEVHSAGLAPKGIHPLTIRVMEEIGIALGEHSSKSVQVYLGKMVFTYLITVCDHAEQNCPTVWPGVSHRLHWSFDDPAVYSGSEGEQLAKFREIRDQIEQKVRDWVIEQVGTESVSQNE